MRKINVLDWAKSGEIAMKRILKITLVLSMLLCIGPLQLYAFKEETHSAINAYIAQGQINDFSLNDYLTNQLGFEGGAQKVIQFGESKRIWQWIGKGGETEDATWLRSCNHFHDPISNTGFNGILCNGDSSMTWAQKPKSTQDPGGYYSWFDTRDFFYKALTTNTKTDRDKFFAETFRGVGQLMHLVQDISVPAHVRNQAHIGYHYEGFVLKYQNGKVPIPEMAEVAFNSLLANPYPLQSSIFNEAIYDEYTPVPISALWDQN
jgi:hypothetical protein